MSIKQVDSEISDDETLSYYRMNFQALLGSKKNADAVDKLANLALLNKVNEQNNFIARLHKYTHGFETQKNYSTTPYLANWHKETIVQLMQQYNGVLVGLFHFGSHRHVLLDLTAMGIKSTAPIAAHAYFDFHKLVSTSSAEFSDRIHLLEVEGDNVGRKLIKELKSGRLGGIYVDGNMGPSGTRSKEGNVEVDFFQHRISVKSGIARLALLLKRPILPVFCNMAGQQPSVEFGNIINPNDLCKEKSNDEKSQDILQQLYNELADRVQKDPASWEYALCLHRWIVAGNKAFDNTNINNSSFGTHSKECLRINKVKLSVININNNLYWVNTESAKGFKIPTKMISIFTSLYKKGSMKRQDFENNIKKLDENPTLLLRQMTKNQLVNIEEVFD